MEKTSTRKLKLEQELFSPPHFKITRDSTLRWTVEIIPKSAGTDQQTAAEVSNLFTLLSQLGMVYDESAWRKEHWSDPLEFDEKDAEYAKACGVDPKKRS